jgi:hypothetical protein
MKKTNRKDKNDILTRLLATENVTIIRGSFKSASFQPQERILRLPIWKDHTKEDGIMDDDVEFMFSVHEVGHALETPADYNHGDTPRGIPFRMVNIVEDSRIERKMLTRYAGAKVKFMRGYKKFLGEMDAMGIKKDNIDVNKLGFLDRINVSEKARGMFGIIDFNEEEFELLKEVQTTDTFEDVLVVCKKIADYLKEQKQDENESQTDTSDTNQEQGDEESTESTESTDGEGDEESTGDEGDEESTDTTDGDEGDEESTDTTDGDESGDEGDDGDELKDDEESTTDSGTGENNDFSEGVAESEDDIESITDENLRKTGENIVDTDTVYIKATTLKGAKSHIVPFKELSENRKIDHYMSVLRKEGRDGLNNRYIDFIKDTKSTVGHMAREFEMRKSAYRQLRARTSTKGTLDVNKLHKYEYDDMLFKQVSHLADGKNHGMMMLIDYSGSMGQMIQQVLDQTIALVMFCKKVNIPFKVYGFNSVASNTLRNYFQTKGYPYGEKDFRPTGMEGIIGTEGVHEVYDNWVLYDLVNSDMKKSTFNKALYEMYMLDRVNKHNTRNHMHFECMGSTPLNASLFGVKQLMDDFQKTANIQKMNLITLTDGDSDQIYLMTPNQYAIRPSSGYDGFEKAIIDYGTHKQTIYRKDFETSAILKNLFGNVTTIHFDLLPYINNVKNKASAHIRHQLGANPDYSNYWDKVKVFQKESLKTIKKEGILVWDKTGGYDRTIIVTNDSDSMRGKISKVEVTSDMTPAQTAKAFGNGMAGKKRSKVFARAFAEVVS